MSGWLVPVVYTTDNTATAEGGTVISNAHCLQMGKEDYFQMIGADGDTYTVPVHNIRRIELVIEDDFADQMKELVSHGA